MLIYLLEYKKFLQLLWFHFLDGKKTVMGDKAYENIHVVASILKMYLRLLPIPLITFDVHPLVLQSLGKHLIFIYICVFLKSIPMLNIKFFFRNSNVLGKISRSKSCFEKITTSAL